MVSHVSVRLAANYDFRTDLVTTAEATNRLALTTATGSRSFVTQRVTQCVRTSPRMLSVSVEQRLSSQKVRESLTAGQQIALICGTRKAITVFTSARCWPLFSASLIQSTRPVVQDLLQRRSTVGDQACRCYGTELWTGS